MIIFSTQNSDFNKRNCSSNERNKPNSILWTYYQKLDDINQKLDNLMRHEDNET